MKWFKLALSFVVALLVGCGSGYEMVHSYEPPESSYGLQCISQCEQAKQACEVACRSSAACEKQAREMADVKYRDYMAMQRSSGQPVTRTKDSFYDPRQCSMKLCQCIEEFNACYELCGGAVTSERVSVS